MRNSATTIVLFCLLVVIFGCGPSKEEKEAAEIPPEPQLTPWLDEETFVTIRSVGILENSVKGFVSIRGLTTKRVYSAEVEIYREIPVGSEVKVSNMHWPRTSAQRAGPDSGHLIVTEVLPVLPKK